MRHRRLGDDRARQAQRAIATARAEIAATVGVEQRTLDILGHAHVAAQHALAAVERYEVGKSSLPRAANSTTLMPSDQTIRSALKT